jgi:hypothetical protein
MYRAAAFRAESTGGSRIAENEMAVASSRVAKGWQASAARIGHSIKISAAHGSIATSR